MMRSRATIGMTVDGAIMAKPGEADECCHKLPRRLGIPRPPEPRMHRDVQKLVKYANR